MSGRARRRIRRDAREPGVVRGGRPPTGRRLARLLRVLVVVALLALVLYPAALAGVASTAVDRERVEGLAASRPMHVLVTGSDSRADLSDEERVELTTGADEGGLRTDTIFVLSIGGGRAAMLAFPRDLFVERCDGSTGRINVAMQLGGPGCLVETVSDLSGLRIAHWMQIDFGGFRELVDAVDGVELCLPSPISDRDAGIDLPAGCQVLGGVEALGYVRVRKIDNDLERIKRQQQFIEALAARLTDPAVLADPVRAFRVARAGGGAIRADSDYGVIDLGRTAWGLRGMARSGITAATVPTVPDTVGGAAVLRMVGTEAEPLFDAYRDGSVLDDGPTAS